MRNILQSIILFLLVATLSIGAHAQTQPASEDTTEKVGGSFFDNLAGAATYIKKKAGTSVADTLFNAGLGYSRQTLTWALAVAGSLATLYLVMESIGLLSGRNSSAVQVLFDVGLPVVLAAYLLLNYENLILTFAGKGGFLDYVRNFAGDATLTIMDMYSAILKLIADSITQSWVNFRGSLKLSPNVITNVVGAAVDVVGTLLFSLVIIVLCFSGLAEIVGLVLMGPFLGGVAVAFGPIFISTVVTPWTRDYFGKWLGFLVGSAVLTGVVSLCVGIATTLFTTFGFADIAGETTPSATALLIAAIMIMSINSLIQQAPGIASALVPGSIGASRGAGGAVSKGVEAVKGKAKAIGDTAKGIRDSAKKNLDKGGPGGNSEKAPATNNTSALDKIAGGNAALKYPTLQL